MNRVHDCCKDAQQWLKINASCVTHSHSHEENDKHIEIRVKDKSPVCKIRVDGCWIADTKKEKCDLLFHHPPTRYWYFVELKGTSIDKALNQIIQTLKDFKAACPSEQYNSCKRFGIIVCQNARTVPMQIVRKKIDRLKAEKVVEDVLIRTGHYTHHHPPK